MLSRRNIRIKIMQLLYAKSRNADLDKEQVLEQYNENVKKAFDLYIFNLGLMCKVAEFSIQDFNIRGAKLLPSEADKTFKPELSSNEIFLSLKANGLLGKELQRIRFESRCDKENVHSIYKEFLKNETYLAYIKNNKLTDADHKAVLLALYKHCINNVLFVETLDDEFLNWVDDKSLVVGAMKKTIKACPVSDDFMKEYRPVGETISEFGEVLLNKILDDDEELLGIIEPNLKNWDAERVAIIDMILLKMAIAELLIFPSIPTKVTLNEFVEISKLYSTDKSKDFINGILDRLMRKLTEEGKIAKKGRGLVD